MEFRDREHFEEELAKNLEAAQEELNKAKKGKPGFFQMNHVHEAVGAKSHDEAKAAAHKAIDAQPSATTANIVKAKSMVNSSRNQKHLAQGMSNFLLAHTSEDLATTK